MLHEILLILNGLESDPNSYLETNIPDSGESLHAGEKDLVEKCLSLGLLYKELGDYLGAGNDGTTGLYEFAIRSVLKKRMFTYSDCLIQLETDFVKNKMGSVRFWLETLEPVG